jgi:lipopolysaccharide heptosyltransferase II
MAEVINKLKVNAIRAFVRTANVFMPRRRSSDETAGRFLIVSTTGMGDTLWGTPAIRALRKAYPGGYIAVLTNTVGAEILKGNPAINEVFIFRRRASGLLRLPVLIAALRNRKFGTAFIFHASDRIVWPLVFLSGAADNIGFKGQSKDMDFTMTKTVDADPAAHGVSNRFQMLAGAGVAEKDELLEIYLAQKDEAEAGAFLECSKIAKEELIVGLHPGAQKPFKCWPVENFIEAGNKLREKYGCRIVITGDASEKEVSDRVAAGIDSAVSAAGRLSIRGSAALIRRMSLFITNDTGPMHIAFALKTPAIALFSPTNPALCGPYKAGKVAVLYNKTTCVPCTGKKCFNPLCLSHISPQEVMDAAAQLLAEPKS